MCLTGILYVKCSCCRVDPDSTLHKDLMQLRGQEGTDHVLLNMTFTVSDISAFEWFIVLCCLILLIPSSKVKYKKVVFSSARVSCLWFLYGWLEV